MTKNVRSFPKNCSFCLATPCTCAVFPTDAVTEVLCGTRLSIQNRLVKQKPLVSYMYMNILSVCMFYRCVVFGVLS